MWVRWRCTRPQLCALLRLKENIFTRFDGFTTIVASIGRHVKSLHISVGAARRCTAAAVRRIHRCYIFGKSLPSESRRPGNCDFDRVVLADYNSSNRLNSSKVNSVNMNKTVLFMSTLGTWSFSTELENESPELARS